MNNYRKRIDRNCRPIDKAKLTSLPLLSFVSTIIKKSVKMRKLTQEEFIERATEVHNGKYDYSKVNYVNNSTKVCIICPIHGEFWQVAGSHLRKHGCPKCNWDSHKKYVYGIGINDDICYKNDINVYKKWQSMLMRCYYEPMVEPTSNYVGCTVCDEWKYFSNFKKWVNDTSNGYNENYHLDKDLLKKNNTVYSPDTCCFLPHEINSMIIRNKKQRGKYLIGVSIDNRNNHFRGCVSVYGKRYMKYAKTEYEAFLFYKEKKEQYIKDIANSYFKEGKITKKVYDALMDYEVELTD